MYSFSANSSAKNLKLRKTLRTGEFPDFEEGLYSWFLKQREKQNILSREIVCEKAKKMFKDVYGNDKTFNASYGWYQKFKTRFNLRYLKICGEKLSSQPHLVPQFILQLKELQSTEGLCDSQIYNADEAALFWKLLPSQTLVHAKERCAPGRKMSKERVTFLCCANKSGDHKLRITVVGKSKKPRSFKNVPPVEYYSSKNGWMTSFIFSEWFHNSFVPQVKAYQSENNLEQKALLIIDNAPCHPTELSHENYKCLFLPPNCTSLIQPMDQNAIRITKMSYKKSLLCHIIGGGEDYDKALKSFTLKDACIFLKHSWGNLREEVIKTCWSKIFNENCISEDDIPLAILRQNINSTETPEEGITVDFMRELVQNTMHINLTNDNLNEWIEESYNTDNEDESLTLSEDDEAEIHVEKVDQISNSEALTYLNKCILWAQQKDLADEKVLQLTDLRNEALELCTNSVKQTTIKDFFKT